MEVTAVLYFLSIGIKLHFYSLGTIFEENMRGIQRGEIPWFWVSNRGEKHPCWHTILLAKSSVLYLLRPLTLERGCPTADRHFSAAAEQADFVGCKLQKTRNLQWAKSACSYVVVIENLEAVRRDLLWQRGRKRYIKPAAAISSRIVFAPFPIQRESSISSEVRSWRVSEFDGLQF